MLMWLTSAFLILFLCFFVLSIERELDYLMCVVWIKKGGLQMTLQCSLLLLHYDNSCLRVEKLSVLCNICRIFFCVWLFGGLFLFFWKFDNLTQIKLHQTFLSWKRVENLEYMPSWKWIVILVICSSEWYALLIISTIEVSNEQHSW